MQLKHNLHLAYCTNVHRGETWARNLRGTREIHAGRETARSPTRPYAIGLRLSAQAAFDLTRPNVLTAFKHWLDKNGCYVFTINGFPSASSTANALKNRFTYRTGHRSAVSILQICSSIFSRNWCPPNIEGSVSTVPGSFKEFIKNADQLRVIRKNIFHSVEHAARVSELTGRRMHLALEPEPLCLFETTHETAIFFDDCAPSIITIIASTNTLA